MGANIGVIGMAVMGQNLALNIESRGNTVAVFNRTAEKTRELMAGPGKDKRLLPASTLEELVASLSRPRTLLIMVQAGKPVDEIIGRLTPLLSPGDIIIDGGNSWFQDTVRRAREAEAKGLLFLGAGVSGGEEGALHGPSIMPGGHSAAYDSVGKILRDISAKVDGEPCCTYIGSDGAGHYVKMVHNGIEYGDMQLISEAYFIMKNLLGMDYPEMSGVFARWNQGDLDSFLIQITADILGKKDPETGAPMVEQILDKAGQKGTGKWTIQSALDLGVASPTIAEAVFARTISAMKDERTEASKILRGPSGAYSGKAGDLVDAVHDALYASKICSYAQGFSLMRGAGAEFGWSLKFGEIAISGAAGASSGRASLAGSGMHTIGLPGLPNLLLDPYFRQIVEKAQPGVASPCCRRGGARCPNSSVLVRPFVFRFLPLGEASRESHPGPEGLLRRPHLPEGGPAGDLP